MLRQLVNKMVDTSTTFLSHLQRGALVLRPLSQVLGLEAI